jgi:hypothetical protein
MRAANYACQQPRDAVLRSESKAGERGGQLRIERAYANVAGQRKGQAKPDRRPLIEASRVRELCQFVQSAPRCTTRRSRSATKMSIDASEQNPGSAPVTTTTRTFGSSATTSSAAKKASSSGRVRAFS